MIENLKYDVNRRFDNLDRKFQKKVDQLAQKLIIFMKQVPLLQ